MASLCQDLQGVPRGVGTGLGPLSSVAATILLMTPGAFVVSSSSPRPLRGSLCAKARPRVSIPAASPSVGRGQPGAPAALPRPRLLRGAVQALDAGPGLRGAGSALALAPTPFLHPFVLKKKPKNQKKPQNPKAAIPASQCLGLQLVPLSSSSSFFLIFFLFFFF